MAKIAWEIYTLFVFLAGHGDRLMPKPPKTRGAGLVRKHPRPKLDKTTFQTVTGRYGLPVIEIE